MVTIPERMAKLRQKMPAIAFISPNQPIKMALSSFMSTLSSIHFSGHHCHHLHHSH